MALDSDQKKWLFPGLMAYGTLIVFLTMCGLIWENKDGLSEDTQGFRTGCLVAMILALVLPFVAGVAVEYGKSHLMRWPYFLYLLPACVMIPMGAIAFNNLQQPEYLKAKNYLITLYTFGILSSAFFIQYAVSHYQVSYPS